MQESGEGNCHAPLRPFAPLCAPLRFLRRNLSIHGAPTRSGTVATLEGSPKMVCNLMNAIFTTTEMRVCIMSGNRQEEGEDAKQV